MEWLRRKQKYSAKQTDHMGCSWYQDSEVKVYLCPICHAQSEKITPFCPYCGQKLEGFTDGMGKEFEEKFDKTMNDFS